MESDNSDSDEHIYHHLLSIADAMIARCPTTAEEDTLLLESVSKLPPRWVWRPAQWWRSFRQHGC